MVLFNVPLLGKLDFKSKNLKGSLFVTRLCCNAWKVSQRRIILDGPDIEWNWVFKLISSTPSLVKLILPKIEEQSEGLEAILELNLPNLTHLQLQYPPKDKPVKRSEPNSAQVFSQLLTPKLESMEFEHIFNFTDLASLNPICSPKALRIQFTTTSHPNHKSDDASSFVNAIKSWERLEKLDLDLRSTAGGSFWTQLLSLLTPFLVKVFSFLYASLGACRPSLAQKDVE